MKIDDSQGNMYCQWLSCFLFLVSTDGWQTVVFCHYRNGDGIRTYPKFTVRIKCYSCKTHMNPQNNISLRIHIDEQLLSVIIYIQPMYVEILLSPFIIFFLSWIHWLFLKLSSVLHNGHKSIITENVDIRQKDDFVSLYCHPGALLTGSPQNNHY